MKLNAEYPLFLYSVNDEGFGARAGENRLAIHLVAVQVVRIVNSHPVIAQIEDHARLAIWHEPFFAVGLWRTFPIPKALSNDDRGGAGMYLRETTVMKGILNGRRLPGEPNQSTSWPR